MKMTAQTYLIFQTFSLSTLIKMNKDDEKKKKDYCQNKKANRELRHNIYCKDKNEMQQKIIIQNNRSVIYNKEFNLDNQPS
jgi:hypothetical protein